MINLYYLFFILSIIWLLYKKQHFVIWLPLFNLILDSSFTYFETLSVVTFIRPAVFLILFYFFAKRFSFNTLNKPLFNFLIFTLLLVLFSSEMFYSFKGYMQVFISMMTFVIGFIYFDNISKLHKLNKTLLYVLAFTVGFTAVGYIFGIGNTLEYTYKIDPEAIGLLRSFGLYSAAVTIGILPLVLISFQDSIWRWLLLSLAVVAYIFILLNVRRTAISIPIIGLLTFAWFIPNKSKVITGVIIAFAILILLFPFYGDKFMSRYMVREEQGRFDEDFYETESRYLENISLFTAVFSFQDPVKSLFGSKIYASGRDEEERKRMYHSDSASLLDGTGIVGVLIYVYFLYRLFKFGTFFKNTTSPHYQLYKSTYYSLLFILLFASLGGSLMNVTLRSLLFLFMGALLSLMYHSTKELCTQE